MATESSKDSIEAIGLVEGVRSMVTGTISPMNDCQKQATRLDSRASIDDARGCTLIR